jgi:hypothetical protein
MPMNPSDLPDSWPPSKKDLEVESEANLVEGLGPEMLAPPIADMELAKSLALDVPRAYLWERCVEAVDTQCVLVDLPVLWTRSVAQVVVELMGRSPLHWMRGVPVPVEHKDGAQEWVDQRIEEAIEDLALEDEEAYLQGEPQPDPEEPRHTGLTETYGVDPDGVLAAAVRFNRLEFEWRQAFFAIFVERMDLSESVVKGMGAPEYVKQLAEEALKALLTPDEPDTGIRLEDIL